jgi:hypothetical protein
MARSNSMAIAALLLAGCWGRGFEYEGGPGSTGDTGPTTTEPPQECGSDVDTSTGYRVEGMVLDLETGASLDGNLCITAIDPTPAVTGGPPTTMGSAKVCDGGEFIVANLDMAPAIGMFLVVDDCEEPPETDSGTYDPDQVFRTATGINGDAIAELGDGDALTGIEALVVTQTFAVTLQDSVELAGYTGTPLVEAGYLAGFALDASEAPVAGAQIVAGCCPDVYYADDDWSDGVFTTGSQANGSTTVEGGAMWLIPGAPVFTYEVDDGGTHTWEPGLRGSLPAYGVFIDFIAE